VNENVWSCSSDKTICVWTKEGTRVKKMEGHMNKVFALAQLNEETVWSGSWDTYIFVWDATNLSFVDKLKAHEDAVTVLLPIRSPQFVDLWSGSADRSVRSWLSFISKKQNQNKDSTQTT